MDSDSPPRRIARRFSGASTPSGETSGDGVPEICSLRVHLFQGLAARGGSSPSMSTMTQQCRYPIPEALFLFIMATCFGCLLSYSTQLVGADVYRRGEVEGLDRRASRS